MKTINVTIGIDGSVDLDLAGFSGKACVEETGKLEALLEQAGISTDLQTRNEKPEMAIQHHQVVGTDTGRQG